jgi:hypothetical protein
VPALVLLAACAARASAAPCPGAATVAIHADNASAAGEVTLEVEGELLDPERTCDGDGAVAYAGTMVCRGRGAARCGEIPGLRPGAWVHRVRVAVPGSDPQVQRRRSVLLAGSGVANVVSWTVYPLSIVVREATDAALRTALDAAAAFTAANPGARALVTFDPAVTKIDLGFTPPSTCRPSDDCPDGAKAAYCMAGSNVVVDGLDGLGRPGGVVVSLGTCSRPIFRITGANNVLRGLELRGSEKPPPADEVDSIVFAGAEARGNRLEECIVHGPTRGDAVTVGDQAGAPGGPGIDNVIVASEVTGAEGKGVKVTAGAHLTLADSCVHDNADGGVQLLAGGTVSALRNVVQLNRSGSAPHGLLVGVKDEVGPTNVLVTDGNVVRFCGGRGVSVVNEARTTLRHDVISENQVAGIRVETTSPGVMARANVRGVGLSCNHKWIDVAAPTCSDDSEAECETSKDCEAGSTCRVVEPAGFGAVVGVVGTCAGCQLPVLDLGQGGRDAGRNALTLNANPDRSTAGVNLSNRQLWTRPLTVLARGNQWESCGTDGQCDVAQVQKRDVGPPDQPGAADLGQPVGPRGGPAPVITRIVPARPRAGDFVRVYNGSLEGIGGPFNAIEGTACSPAGAAPIGVPSDPCSPESPATVARNRAARAGDKVTVTIGDTRLDAEVHAVTPTMLLFRMPVDCFAPATLVASRGTVDSPAATLCDPASCADRSAGEPCDDGNACTVGERCDEQGACVAAAALSCAGPCLTGACDPAGGCVLAATDAICDDGNPCTADRCVGLGACQSAPLADGAACPQADVCRSGPGVCRGGVCDGGPPLACDDGDFCTDDLGCDPQVGCRFLPVAGVRRTTCLLDTARAVLGALPRGGGAAAGRRLTKALDRAERWARRADRAKRPARARFARRHARHALRDFLVAARRKRGRLGTQVKRQVSRLGKQAIETLRTPT